MVIWWMNLVSNAMVLAVCVWAVLNQRVETKVVGTISLSSLGLFAALNLLRLSEFDWRGGMPQAMTNVSLACLLVWMFLRYQRYLKTRRIRRARRVKHGASVGFRFFS